MTIADGQLIQAADHLRHSNASGYADLAASTILTIAAGVVTQVQNFHRIAGEGAADDDLDTITAAADVTDGYVLLVRSSSDSVNITLRHGTGNLQCAGGRDIILDNDDSHAWAVWDNNLSAWIVNGPQDFYNTTQTTDGTVTTILTYTTRTDSITLLRILVVARRTAGASGSAGDGAVYIVNAAIKNISGTASEIAAEAADYSAEDQAGWDVTVTVTGATALVIVTGAAGNTVSWQAWVTPYITTTQT